MPCIEREQVLLPPGFEAFFIGDYRLWSEAVLELHQRLNDPLGVETVKSGIGYVLRGKDCDSVRKTQMPIQITLEISGNIPDAGKLPRKLPEFVEADYAVGTEDCKHTPVFFFKLAVVVFQIGTVRQDQHVLGITGEAEFCIPSALLAADEAFQKPEVDAHFDGVCGHNLIMGISEPGCGEQALQLLECA